MLWVVGGVYRVFWHHGVRLSKIVVRFGTGVDFVLREAPTLIGAFLFQGVCVCIGGFGEMYAKA